MKRKIFLLIIFVIFIFASCGRSEEEPFVLQPPPEREVIDIGEGGTVFRFEAIDYILDKQAWNVHTNEETVGAALYSLGLIDGDRTPFGLFITTVNGLRTDFLEMGSWWSFYIDGCNIGIRGVDETIIEPGRVYTLVYSVE